MKEDTEPLSDQATGTIAAIHMAVGRFQERLLSEIDPALLDEGRGHRATLLEPPDPRFNAHVYLVDPDAELPAWDRDRHWQYTHAVFVVRPTLRHMVSRRVADIERQVRQLCEHMRRPPDKPPQRVQAPQLFVGVASVEIRRSSNWRSTPSNRTEWIQRIDRAIRATTDRRLLAVAAKARAALVAMDTEELRVRQESVQRSALIHFDAPDAPSADVRIRQQGIVVVGDDVEVITPDVRSRRKRRTDAMRGIEPIFTWKGNAVYDARAWERAKLRLR